MVPFTIGLTFTLPCKQASRSSTVISVRLLLASTSFSPSLFARERREETKQFKHNKSCVYFLSRDVVLVVLRYFFFSLSRRISSNACSVRFVLSSHPILYINWVRDWVVDSILVCKITLHVKRTDGKERKKTWQTQAETYIFIQGVFLSVSISLQRLQRYSPSFLSFFPPPPLSDSLFESLQPSPYLLSTLTYSIRIPPDISLAWRKFTPSNFLEDGQIFPISSEKRNQRLTEPDHVTSSNFSQLSNSILPSRYLAPRRNERKLKETSRFKLQDGALDWIICEREMYRGGIQMACDPSSKLLDLENCSMETKKERDPFSRMSPIPRLRGSR